MRNILQTINSYIIRSIPYYLKPDQFVRLNQYFNSQQLIVRVIQLSDDNQFECLVYLTPEQTHRKYISQFLEGRQDHQGTHELLKSDIEMKEHLQHVDSKLQVLKLKDYYHLSDQQKKSKYFFRQGYRNNTKEYNPIDLPICICKKIVNPDDNLVMCQECGIFYHYECSDNGVLKCSYCYEYIDQQEMTKAARRKNIDIDDGLIKLVKKDTGYNFNLNNIKIIKSQSANNQTVSNTNASKNVNNSNLSKSGQMQVQKDGNRQQQINRKYRNLNDFHYNRLIGMQKRFKQQNPINPSMSEKLRYIARENIFCCLIYGVEEVRQEKEIGNSEWISLKNINDNQEYELGRKLAIEIETNIYTLYYNHIANNGDKYREKGRMILATLNNQKNFELRTKVLTNRISPRQLSTSNEQDLLNEENKKYIEKRKKNYLQSHILEDQQILIAKTHKGEQILEEQQDVKQDSVKEESEEMSEQQVPLNNTNSQVIPNEQILNFQQDQQLLQQVQQMLAKKNKLRERVDQYLSEISSI